MNHKFRVEVSKVGEATKEGMKEGHVWKKRKERRISGKKEEWSDKHLKKAAWKEKQEGGRECEIRRKERKDRKT